MAEEEDAGEEGEGKKKVGGKKLILFIVLPILIVAGAGVGVYMSGLLDPLLGIEETAEDGEGGEGASVAAAEQGMHRTRSKKGEGGFLEKKGFLHDNLCRKLSSLREVTHVTRLPAVHAVYMWIVDQSWQ